MTGTDSDGSPPVAWHNRTSTLLGASVAALALIAVVVGSISFVVRQSNDPEPAYTNFVEPTYSQTERSVSTPTTTATITSTSPPVTTDINPETSPPPTESSVSTLTTRPPRTKETETEDADNDDDDETTSRRRPRLNVTRTLTPVQ